MKPAIAAFLTVLAVSLLSVPVIGQNYSINPERFGALAYSPKTGQYGYAWNQGSRALAERTALADCKADDAKLLTWVRFGWAALVIGEDNSYGYDEVHGDGVNSKDAYEAALKNLRGHSTANVKTIIVICSGDEPPKVIKK